MTHWLTDNLESRDASASKKHYFLLKSVQINWIPLYQLIIINWNNWKIETIGVCFCREIPNVGNHLREIEEGPPFLLKWVLRLDMQLQTEPEQFGICKIEEDSLSLLKWLLRLDMQLQTESEQFGIFDLWDWGGPSLPTQVTSETCFGIANRVRAIWDLLSPKQQMTFSWIEIGSLRDCPF